MQGAYFYVAWQQQGRRGVLSSRVRSSVWTAGQQRQRVLMLRVLQQLSCDWTAAASAACRRQQAHCSVWIAGQQQQRRPPILSLQGEGNFAPHGSSSGAGCDASQFTGCRAAATAAAEDRGGDSAASCVAVFRLHGSLVNAQRTPVKVQHTEALPEFADGNSYWLPQPAVSLGCIAEGGCFTKKRQQCRQGTHPAEAGAGES